MIDGMETAVRLAGAGGFTAALIFSGFAAARGRHRAAGRGIGLAPRLGALTTYVLGAIPYFATWVLLWSPLPGTPSPTARLALLSVGAALGGAGLSLYVWGRLTLADMYNVSSALGVELYAGHRLVTTGPFQYVRHPMYVGIGLAALGGLAVYRTWSMVFAVAWVVVVFRVKARHEEKVLTDEFGPAWDTYAGRVPPWRPHLLEEKEVTL